jgi:hypothetical protein
MLLGVAPARLDDLVPLAKSGDNSSTNRASGADDENAHVGK